MKLSSSERCCTKSVDATRERSDECHHVTDEFLLWCLVLFFHQDCKFHTIIFEDAFKQIHTKTSQSVSVGDEESIDCSLLCKSKEPPEPSTFHVQPRADISEDQRWGLEVLPAMTGERLKLSIKVAIGFLTMSRNQRIDSTSFLDGAF